MRSSLLALAMAASLLGFPALAQQGPAGPTGENLIMTMPRGFKQVVSSGQPKVSALAQYVREGETKEDWTLMLSVHLFYSIAHVAPRQLYGTFESRYKVGCAKFSAQPTDLNVRGYPGLVSFLSCELAPDAPRHVPPGTKLSPQQFMHLKIIQGRDAVYMLQFEWQGPADVKPTPITDEEMRKIFVEPIRNAYVCDSRLPDRPCFGR
jgi:hypothetical protein